MPNVRFYWDFFSKGKPAYVEIVYLALPDAASLIHSAGGAAVLAHPGQNLGGDERSWLEQNNERRRLRDRGIFFIPQQAEALHYLETADRKGLFVTCGSDFHGRHKPNITLGGHNAFWDDRKLLQEMKKCLLSEPPVL